MTAINDNMVTGLQAFGRARIKIHPTPFPKRKFQNYAKSYANVWSVKAVRWLRAGVVFGVGSANALQILLFIQILSELNQ
ncbi:hypothetical protein [Comamonas aquatica]|uniref:hypothetical protein n=1 Tax=Comamonas aquatica TaxID=225991 RepID=UPI0031D1217A